MAVRLSTLPARVGFSGYEDAIVLTTTAEFKPIAASHVREDERGLFVEAINAGPWETVITGSMRAGGVLGDHYHKKTRMFFFLTTGRADVEVVDVSTGERRKCHLATHEGVYLEPNEAHAIRFAEASTFLLLKSTRYREDDPDTFPFPVTQRSA